MNINKTRARKRDSSSERSASVTAPDKKKKNRKKENVILCGNLPHEEPLTPYVCNY